MASAVCLQRPAGDQLDMHHQVLPCSALRRWMSYFDDLVCHMQVIHFMLLAQHKQHHPAFATVSQSFFSSGVRIQPAGS